MNIIQTNLERQKGSDKSIPSFQFQTFSRTNNILNRIQKEQAQDTNQINNIQKQILVAPSKRGSNGSEPLLLFILNLLLPIFLSCVIARLFLFLEDSGKTEGVIITAATITGLIISLISNLRILGWKQTLKFYFLLDSLVPVFISGVLSFSTVLYVVTAGTWYWFNFAYTIAFPSWLIYFCGSMRISIKYWIWSKQRVIVYKIACLCCGLLFFYVGLEYMNGKYKITNGLMVQFQNKLKNTVLLFVFGNVEIFFSIYRRISHFDQSEHLKYNYSFQNQSILDQVAINFDEIICQ